MSASREWTEWHLSPTGWERGTQKMDGSGVEHCAPPPTRFLTKRYSMEVGFGSPHTDLVEEYRSDDAASINSLLEQYGECPKHL